MLSNWTAQCSPWKPRSHSGRTIAGPVVDALTSRTTQRIGAERMMLHHTPHARICKHCGEERKVGTVEEQQHQKGRTEELIILFSPFLRIFRQNPYQAQTFPRCSAGSFYFIFMFFRSIFLPQGRSTETGWGVGHVAKEVPQPSCCHDAANDHCC